MFTALFAENGLSLDRLKALLEVGVSGSITQAAGHDPVRQSLYSRQLKELESFFQTKLVERQGRGMRLTPAGKELARISRFFLMGLSNFRRGCQAERQAFRIGASATFIQELLLPALASPTLRKSPVQFATEVSSDETTEQRLQELTLDFGILGHDTPGRPLKTSPLGTWQLQLWAPQAQKRNAARAYAAGKLPLVLADKELAGLNLWPQEPPARLRCDSFLAARAAMVSLSAAGLLPSFLPPPQGMTRVPLPSLDKQSHTYHLAWNPRLLRLNPQAETYLHQLRDSLTNAMSH